ncbi:IS1380 family transposase [Jiangella alkaliphila]|uniref:Transposase DDE domain group 1 n=1 Tax=Jiangella alkaliphila TaxID=419479 RepID=A0A1H2L903_9ACTN|nr:IS1380 family transposase [Jiangella alkaliphila]SDU57159.1 Transposase DDE domain group 1 [Jiangella alkaliphila]SDU67674.1 Transposase DDE domain group 1 [Jiangella alkaliphila]SDU69657.1 Transposase DDE domain group 1 [Jiangella alkaliphila]SDU72148.1 Transposase DDE domain group 1 [Jiangella alkaliphila]SDU75275.1 Transposase DDE domain group 1 [Jiangella alkaliphila]
MQLSHTRPVVSAAFDEPNLVSSAGLVPAMALAGEARLRELGDEHLSVPTDKGANAGLKLSGLVAGMTAGADSIDDMALLRHGAMGKVFAGIYAPSTLGSFLRAFTFGHVRQADAIASRFLINLTQRTALLGETADTATVMVDIDDTIVEVHGYQKQGAGFGYSGVRGLNAVLATVSSQTFAPVIAAQRLRNGSAGSPRGATRLATDALALIRRTHLAGRDVLVRADSAFYSHALVTAALKAGANVSITVRMDPAVKRAIAGIAETAWTTIKYTDAVYDETTRTWNSRAEVAEVPFTAFTSKNKTDQVPGRLVVRRIPDLNPRNSEGQDTLFDSWRFHAFFTTTDTTEMDTVAADQTHRAHAVIENVHADLKASALAHLPSGVFNANAAWLVCAVMAFNLTRAAATLTKTPTLTRATTATIRRKLITVPARIATSARRLTLHLPTNWPWQTAWSTLYNALFPRPATTHT